MYFRMGALTLDVGDDSGRIETMEKPEESAPQSIGYEEGLG
jgi:hypothetical protein